MKHTIVYTIMGLFACLLSFLLGSSKTEEKQKERVLDAVKTKNKLSSRVTPERIARWVRK